MIKKFIFVITIFSFISNFSACFSKPTIPIKATVETNKPKVETNKSEKEITTKIDIKTVDELYNNDLFRDLYFSYMNNIEGDKELYDLFFLEETPIIFNVWLSMPEGSKFTEQRIKDLFINIENSTNSKVKAKLDNSEILNEQVKKEDDTEKVQETQSSEVQDNQNQETFPCHFCGKYDVASNINHLHGIGYWAHSYCLETLNYCKKCGKEDILTNDMDGDLICDTCDEN